MEPKFLILHDTGNDKTIINLNQIANISIDRSRTTTIYLKHHVLDQIHVKESVATVIALLQNFKVEIVTAIEAPKEAQ